MQTYAFGTGVAAMGVTLTAAGLTPKSVVLATTAGQLVAINKNLLDPRRPLVHPSKMRQQDREEGLIPYASTLGGVNPLTVLTHRHSVARPAHVLTAPTTLESTSLVVGVGLESMVKRRVGRAAAASLLGSYIWPLGCAREGHPSRPDA